MASHKDFAPAVAGPVNTRKLASVDDFNLTLQKGFPILLKAIDGQSGEPIQNATLVCRFSLHDGDLGTSVHDALTLTTLSNGTAQLLHCADLPLAIHVEKEGYQYGAFKFS